MTSTPTLEGVALPTRRDEAWRYAPHRRLAELTFGPSDGDVAAAIADDLDRALADRVPALDGPRIVVVNGLVDPARSAPGAVAGVAVTALAAAPSEATRMHTDRGEVADGFGAYHLAFATDGAFVDVDAGVRVDVPIHIVDVAVPGTATNTSCTGVMIRLGAGSSATVVESRIGLGADIGGSSLRTTIVLADDATLDHVIVQDLPFAQVHLSRVEADQAAGSTLRTRAFNLGAAYGRLAYHVELNGAGATAELTGLYFGVGDQVLDQQITVVHAQPDCTSRQLFRGVLDDASTGVFNGGIDVRPGADGTDAEQANDNLLLSDRAEANSQPRLEILADEVACKHGATVGQLDEQALYYLRSRGIAAEEARRLLINGFADQIVDEVGVEAVRTWITHRLGHDDD